MKKDLWKMMVALLMTMTLMAIQAACAETEGDFSYTITDGAATVTGYTGAGGVVKVPDTLGGCPVVGVGDYAFLDCTALESMTLPASVQELGVGAFARCTGLTSMTIPDGVTHIPSELFMGCKALTSVNIPSSVTGIADYAFDGCAALENIKLPPLTDYVGYMAFHGCPGAETVVLEEGATVIEYGAFQGCTNLKSVTIADSVNYIGEFAFNACPSLEKMVIKGDSMPRISNELEYDAYSFTVWCKKGSEIENWANKRGLAVEYIPVPTRKLVSLTHNEDYWHVGALASVTANYTGSSDIESMEYTVFNGKGEVISTTAIIADTFSFVVPDYGSYVVRASMKAQGGEWHCVDSAPIVVKKPVTPIRLIEFETNTEELKVGEQINFSLRYEGDDYANVAKMLFYTYDGNGQQLGAPWTHDGFIDYYGFIPSVPGKYAIRVFMLTKDGGEQVVTSPFFQAKGGGAQAIKLKGFTADRKELRVGELINFLLDYTGSDTANIGWMKFYTYNIMGEEVGDPWTWNGFIGHYGFISSMPGQYAIRVFMMPHEGEMQVVTSPFFNVAE